ncbi:chromosomal replication initiator protein DnaA [Psychrobacter sp. 72-O-c]|uniref:chromosomal replication initiator protein DnaA n=1 Tax=Psychrobacter sp. 72-O-c TaxID=2774125 RepID=UPI00191B39BA|nr:chromosomal replication initiator protein DnaA [Psychrobacter sp. 72-O-c]
MIDTATLWDKCLDDLRYHVKDNVFTMWLRPLSAHQEAQTLVIRAPNDYFVSYIKKNHLHDIQELVAKHSQGSIEEVIVRVDNANHSDTSHETADSESQASGSLFGEDSLSPPLGSQASKTSNRNADSHSNNYSNNNLNSNSNNQADSDGNMQHAALVEAADAKSLSYLNPDFTFETFVTGKSNNLAYKACYELSKRQSKNRHNPLFIYGPSGLGKTHLMHSVAHRYLKNNRSFYYFTSEKFINQLVYSLRNNKIEDFKKKIKKVDLLIVDDIHVLAGKTKSSNEFLTLFADFTSGDKQLILASDRHPSQMTEFDERFRSRFSWGLTVAVDPPEIDTRVQILQKKAAWYGMTLPKDCALFIAQNVVSNVRRLEGALNQVFANANLTGAPITLEMVQYALKDIVAMRVQAVNMDNIRKVVAEYYDVSVKDLMGRKRTRSIARPRQIAMALSRELTGDSYPDIGQSFGGRDHTTVMHGCDKVAQLRAADPAFDKDYKSLAMMLQA